MADFSGYDFVEIAKNQYPYETLHASDCASVKRASEYRTRPLDFETVAFQETRTNAFRRDKHTCLVKVDKNASWLNELQPTDLWKSVQARAAVLRAEQVAQERRHVAVERVAILRAALERYEAELGEPTDEERETIAKYVENLRNRQWAPNPRGIELVLPYVPKEDRS